MTTAWIYKALAKLVETQQSDKGRVGNACRYFVLSVEAQRLLRKASTQWGAAMGVNGKFSKACGFQHMLY